MAAALLCSLLFAAGAARAAVPAPPRTALFQVRSSIHIFAAQSRASSDAGAAGAVRALTRATARSLWINAGEVVAPSYGTRVFTDSATAVTGLQQARHRSVRALAGILRADRDLATGAITRARGGDQHLLMAAAHELAAGDREAAGGRRVSAVGSYAKAWRDAFAALARLVSAQTTAVPSSAVAAAAQLALGSKRIPFTGPRITPHLPLLTLGGKPELLFVGSEACPFCAVERWGMIVALSQFGTFTNLHLMQSDTTEPPVVRTFTFAGSGYRSPYISFVPVEAISNVPKGFGFAPLQRLTAGEHALLRRFDLPTQTPFIDVANRFESVGSTVPPMLLAGMSWPRIASSLTDPASIPAQAVAGEAETLTAELCEATGGNPQSVCASPIVASYEVALPSLGGQGGTCPSARRATAGRRRGQPLRARPARCIV